MERVLETKPSGPLGHGHDSIVPMPWQPAALVACLQAFVAIKPQEWDKYHALVPSTDHDWYLDSV